MHWRYKVKQLTPIEQIKILPLRTNVIHSKTYSYTPTYLLLFKGKVLIYTIAGGKPKEKSE